jgi:hypothetical protein
MFVEKDLLVLVGRTFWDFEIGRKCARTFASRAWLFLRENSLKVPPHFHCRNRRVSSSFFQITTQPAFFRGSHDITKIKMVRSQLMSLHIVKPFCGPEGLNSRHELPQRLAIKYLQPHLPPAQHPFWPLEIC